VIIILAVPVEGGIANGGDGTINITNSTISGNTATGDYAFGGGVTNGGDGTINITNSTISENTTTGEEAFGGGAANVEEGTINITNSTITANAVSGDWAFGGGLANYDDGTINITNSTIFNNSVSGADSLGGGVGIVAGIVSISNSTISKNSAAVAEMGGGIGFYDGTLSIINTIVADNTANSGRNDFFRGDDAATLIDDGNNIIGVSTGEVDAWAATGDWTLNGTSGDTYTLYDIGTTGDLKLSATLAANSTLNDTQTLSVASGSIAIGNGSTVITFDQRGLYRAFNGAATIGAYEYNGVAPTNGDYITNQSGTWATAAIWNTFNGTSWVVASSSPNSASGRITVDNGHEVTVVADVTIDQTLVQNTAELIVNLGKELTINNGTETDLTIAGGGEVGVSGTLTATGAQIVYLGTGTLNLVQETFTVGTFTAGSSTVTYDGTAQAVTALTYNNLNLSGSDAKTVAGNLDVNGTFTNTQAVSISGDLNVEDAATIGASITTSDGDQTYTGAVNVPTVKVSCTRLSVPVPK